MLNSPDTIALRLATLIEVNMNYHLALQRGGTSLPATPTHFQLEKAFVVSEATVEARIPHFFLNMSPFTGGESGIEITHRVLRGY